jgi:hypothetical protein
MKKKKLALSNDLELPFDSVDGTPGAIWQKYAFLGRTGSGKTYAAKKLAELMLEAGAQIIVIDTVGVWPFLRLGPKPFSLPVLGGLYGDVPLEPTGGAVVADFVVDTGSSAVLDTSQMIDAEQVRFATAFGERFFQRKKSSPSPVHLFLEECQDIVPQNTEGFAGGIQRAVNVFNRIVKVGRNFRIGVSLISQRPQEVNKKALNQTECLFAFQMSGVQERKAIAAWMADKGLDVDLVAELPKLAVGQAHVWSPQWLNVSKKIRISKIRSMDASTMPKAKWGGWKMKLPPVDLPALQSRMAETIERAKAEDPKELRAQIAKLKAELAKKPAATAAPVVVKGIKLGPFEMVVDRRHVEQVVESSEHFEKGLEEFSKTLEMVRRRANGAAAAGRRARATGPAALSKRLAKAPPQPAPVTARVEHEAVKKFLNGKKDSYRPPYGKNPHKTNGASAGSLPKGERAIMIAIAQHPNGVTREQLTVLTGYKRSTRDAYLQRLSTSGHVDASNGMIEATADGRHALGSDYQPLPTGHALLEHWLERLPEGERKILEVAAGEFPEAVSRDWIGECTGYKRSTRDAYLQRLETRKLVKVERDGIRLSEELVG